MLGLTVITLCHLSFTSNTYGHTKRAHSIFVFPLQIIQTAIVIKILLVLIQIGGQAYLYVYFRKQTRLVKLIKELVNFGHCHNNSDNPLLYCKYILRPATLTLLSQETQPKKCHYSALAVFYFLHFFPSFPPLSRSVHGSRRSQEVIQQICCGHGT